MLFEILNHKTYEVIFELNKEDNTMKKTVEAAVRKGISLREADLRCADLHGADLRNADLRYAILTHANLSGANLRGADLSYSSIDWSNLNNADLTGANIKNCFIYRTHLDNTIMPDFPMACPDKGSFIGYKKIFYTQEYCFGSRFIVKLEIPEDAKRSSSNSNKCRCSKAKVLEIKDADLGGTIDKITNFNIFPCVYKVEEYVYPDSFDECRWNECSNGIHFFMSEEEAIKYGS